jgi:hypothetical protein
MQEFGFELDEEQWKHSFRARTLPTALSDHQKFQQTFYYNPTYH